jgi:glutamyl-Q tRNA(Asp) synthetase
MPQGRQAGFTILSRLVWMQSSQGVAGRFCMNTATDPRAAGGKTHAAGRLVTRFAPSPTGWLHLGHVHAAWFAWHAARQEGGRYLVRLEDIDPSRCRPAYAAGILEDLAWLGLSSDEPVRVQSAHLDAYRAVLAALAANGLVYPCFCSRAEVARELAGSAAAPHAPDGAPRYPGTCRRLAEAERARRIADGQPHAWRLDMAAALEAAPGLSFTELGPALGQPGAAVLADPAPFGDVVLGRRDVPASYHLCVTHDDAMQGVTLVTRAEDLRPSTHLHVLLQALMGWPRPAYAHHALLRDAEGRRLSKRDGAVAVRALRAAGQTPAEVLEQARGAVRSTPPRDAPGPGWG